MVFLFIKKEYVQIFFKILFVLKYILTVVPSRQHMIDMSFGSYSCCPRHALNIVSPNAFYQLKRTVPFITIHPIIIQLSQQRPPLIAWHQAPLSPYFLGLTLRRVANTDTTGLDSNKGAN